MPSVTGTAGAADQAAYTPAVRMREGLAGFALGAIVGSWSGGCAQDLFYVCQDDAQCDLGGEQGQCLSGECAYPNLDCPSALAYPSGARPDIAGQCVPVDATDTAASSDSTSANDTGDTDDSSTGELPGDPACRVSYLGGGTAHSCLLTADGDVWCWGDNRQLELGSDVGNSTPTPTRVDALDAATVTQLSVSDHHACALTDEAVLWCWGYQQNGELFGADLQGTYLPQPVDITGVSQFAAGGVHTCARQNTTVTCWGDTFWGQSGGKQGNSFNTLLSAVTSGFVELGTRHSCAQTTREAPSFSGVECWGDDERGQLGNGGPIVDGDTSMVPVAVEGLPQPASALALGDRHSCALIDGQTWCWGEDARGQLLGGGDTSSARRLEQVPVVKSLWAGSWHTCTLTDEGTVWCWGDNAYGQVDPLQDGLDVGLWQLTDSLEGSVGEPVTFDVVGSGGDHSCGWSPSLGVVCWGRDDHGQLGTRIGATVGRVALPGCP
ncbi:MAG: hypothetical protein K0V04_30575 [Deltaproteobacteria bacterium]|nr:hypothetical protein [Deltaproteobacteria bacterium]